MDEQPRLHKFSKFMATLCAVVIVVAPLGLLLIWLNFPFLGPYMKQELGLPQDMPVPLESQLLAGLINFTRLGIGLYGLIHLRRTFLEGAQGRCFSADAVSSFRTFAWAAVAYGIAAPIERTLVILAMTLGNPPGERMLSIGISSDHLLALFVGLLFVAVAHMFREGQRLAEENEEFL